MKALLATLALATGLALTAQAQNNVGINTSNPAPSAALMVDTAASGPQGLLIPRMTQARRNAIGSPANGLLVYQSDGANGFYYFNGATWVVLRDVANTYPNVEVNVQNSSSQTISALAGTSNTAGITFSGSNNTNAQLTGGNSWNGSTFTVGSGGAGWYQFSAHIRGVTSAGGETANGVQYFLDVSAAGTPNTAVSTYDLNQSSAAFFGRNSSKINHTLYLAAGATVQLKGQAWSNTTMAYTSTDGSTSLSIVRLK